MPLVVVGTLQQSDSPLVVAARVLGSQPPIWSIHPIGGSILWIRHLARALPDDQPLFGIQAQGLDGTNEPHESVDAMAQHYVQLIRQVQPSGPYRVSGASFGGLVAVEIARKLRDTGEAVGLLALFDTFGPGYPARSYRRRLRQLLVRMKVLPAYEVSALTHDLQDLATSPMLRAVNRVIAASTRAMSAYDPRAYDGPITLFRATRRPPEIGEGFEDPSNGWDRVAPGLVQVIPFDADHRFMLDPPSVHELGRKFAEHVRRR